MISATNTKLLLEFAANGFEFFPLIKPLEGRKLGTPKGWPDLGTDDLAQINSWLQTAKFGFGMSFQSKRYFAFDLDGQEGVEYFKQAMQKHNIPGPSIVFKTPSGGRHLIYAYPQGIQLKNIAGFSFDNGLTNQGTKVDIRADGGFIGSFGARDNGYILLTGSPSDPLVELPENIVALLPKKQETASLAATALSLTKDLVSSLEKYDDTPLFGNIPQQIFEGERDNTIFNLIASWVRVGLNRDNILILCNEALKRCTGRVDDIDIVSMVDRTITNPNFVFAKRSQALQVMLKNLVFLHDVNRYMTLHDKSIMVKSACEDRFANVRVEIETKEGKTKLMPVFDIWLRDEARLMYRNFGYKPGGEDIYYDSLYGADLVNVYRAPDIPIIPNPELFDRFVEFASVICGDDEEKGMFLVEFIAYLVQKPATKIGVAPVIISTKQGVGKNFFLKIVSKLLGEANVISLHSDNITNNFNSALAGAQLIVINESVGEVGQTKFVKNKNSQAMARIKSMITDTNQSIERKGQEIVNQKTYANFLFFSNDESAISLTHLDRRFKCIINDHPARDKEFFDTMDVLKTREGLAALKHGLINLPLYRIHDNLVNYEKSADDHRVIASSLTDLELDVLQDIDNRHGIFCTDFMSKEIFMCYMVKTHGEKISKSICGNLLRKFYEPLRVTASSRNCVAIKADMPVFFIDEAERGGLKYDHYVHQRRGHGTPLTGEDVDRLYLQQELGKAIAALRTEVKKPIHMVK